MERKIGEIFKYKNIKLQVVEAQNTTCICKECELFKHPNSCTKALYITGSCTGYVRTDKKNVVFKKVEKHSIMTEDKLKSIYANKGYDLVRGGGEHNYVLIPINNPNSLWGSFDSLESAEQALKQLDEVKSTVKQTPHHINKEETNSTQVVGLEFNLI